MSWLGIANNQTVSFDNLQDAVTTGYFYALASIPSSLEQITKVDASTYVSIDTAYAPYAAKTSNQLVVKSDLKPIFSYSGTFYYNLGVKFFWYGWDTDFNACSNYSTADSTLISWNGTLGIGTLVFIPNCSVDTSIDPYYVIFFSGVAYWVTLIDEYYDPTTGTCAYSITDIGTCPCEITVNLNVNNGGGGYITVTNQDTFVDYTITAADASGVGQVPAGSYVVTDYGLNVFCPPPLIISVSPMSFSGGCGSTVNIDIGCN
jgi:hypothetical protein